VNQRENFVASLSREGPEWVPHDILLTEPVESRFRKITGEYDYQSYFEVPHRYITIDNVWDPSVPFEQSPEVFSHYYGGRSLKQGTFIDEWGIAYEPRSMHHYCRLVHPMESLQSVRELEDYPFPDELMRCRFPGIRDRVDAIHWQGLSAVGQLGMTIFEIAWYLRGMNNLFMDLTIRKDFASYLLDRITSIRCEVAREYSRAGVDLICLGDDIGTQHGPLMKLELWRKWFKPRLKKVIEAAKEENPDLLIFYHTDGDVRMFIKDLIEIGVEVLNPIQPECMNPAELKRLYGDKLSFWGGVGTQTTLPFGTPTDVKAAVKNLIKNVGYNGGLLVSPTHVVMPDVPWANIVAFYEAVKEYGRYK